MSKIKILWADDEIDMFKPHIIFLESKGYNITTTNSGNGALALINTNHFDIIFLDEHMPGLSGLETLSLIKNKLQSTPIVMITKSEEENIMEDAIGANIADYLIKPVNPNQILLCIKKNLDNKELISKKTSSSYLQEFRNIGNTINDKLNFDQWKDIYKKIIYWEIELEKINDENLKNILHEQKSEANYMFSKFIENNYLTWLKPIQTSKPIMSQTLIKEKILPLLETNDKLFLIVIDNFRYDQWKIIQPVIEELYYTSEDDIYYSILPTATQYARNSIFAGLLPSEIEKKYPQFWMNEGVEGTKNQFESELLGEQLKRFRQDIKYSYNKILNISYGKKIAENISNLYHNKLNVIVYNFLDMLSHAKTEMDIIKELADDEVAYRSLTLSWFIHSPLLEIIKLLAEKKIPLAITTDHGSIIVTNPIKIIGDRNINSNLRYKYGKNIEYNKKEVFEIKNSAQAYLPQSNFISSYIFANEAKYFCYANNFNQYAAIYKNTFQHGGISLEEILIPFIFLRPR